MGGFMTEQELIEWMTDFIEKGRSAGYLPRNENKVAIWSLEVGLLWRKTVRNWLDKIVFSGAEIEVVEYKSFITSEFIIKGPESVVNRVMQMLQSILPETEEEE